MERNIAILPNEWTEKLPNPFSNDGFYGKNFSILKIDEKINVYWMGKSPCGCFSLALNPFAFGFSDRCMDFITYENFYNRCVLLYSDTVDINNKFLDKLNCNYTITEIRETDTEFVVHSTTLSSYKSIIEEDCLKSVSKLEKEGIRKTAVGLIPLGEPKDYLDYVMFAPPIGMGSSSEIVVNSQLHGEVCFDPNAKYTPQARMYFDGYKIIQDGLAVRDGVHPLKVKDALCLSKYLLLTVFEKDVILPNGSEYWTPTLFTEAANEYFYYTMKCN